MVQSKQSYNINDYIPQKIIDAIQFLTKIKKNSSTSISHG